MSEVNLTNLQNGLKRNYPMDEMTNQMYDKRPFLAQVQKLTRKVENVGEGLKSYVPIQISYTTQTGAIAEGGVMPIGRAASYLQLQIPVAYHYSTIEFSGQAMMATKRESFVDLTTQKMEGVRNDTARAIDREITNGNGEGVLCMTNGAEAGGSTTCVVDNPGTQFLEVGMPLLSDTASDGTTGAIADEDISHGLTEATAYYVSSITNETTFVLSTSDKWKDNRYIFRYGAANKEAMGLKGIIDNYAIRATSSYYGLGTALQTIHGQDRNVYPILNANVEYGSVANTAEAISEKRILKLLNKIEDSTGTEKAKSNRMFVSSRAVRDRLWDIVGSDRRITGDYVTLKGGYKALTFQYGNEQIPWIVTKQAIPQCLFVVDLDEIALYQSGNMQWVEQSAGQIFDIKTDSSGRYHIYIATLAYFAGLGCKNFKAQGVLRDITEV